jgi:ribosomal small subunit protein bTHX
MGKGDIKTRRGKIWNKSYGVKRTRKKRKSYRNTGHIYNSEEDKDKRKNRVIADTNIWYKLGDNQELFDKVKETIYPVYNNLWELSATGRLYSAPEKVRNAIRKIMLCSKRMIIEEPLTYLIKQSNKDFHAEISPLTISMKNFTREIANGCYLQENQKDIFYKFISDIKKDLDEIKSDFNETALICKEKIKDLKKHRKQETWQGTVRFINFLAKGATGGKFNIEKLPLSDYELLILVIDNYFKKLETGDIKWQRNDLFDLFNLAYVRKGDKYWTEEKKWINIIKEINCEHYLYKGE